MSVSLFRSVINAIVASVKNVHGFIYLDELIYGKELEDKPNDVTQQIDTLQNSC